MQHLALYRKWRPADFDDVCGQSGITDILRYQVENGRTSHAYLFCGSRGTGKTSCAKILAKAVNCLHPKNGNPCNECAACRSIDGGEAVDVTEMDAASNTGVDNVRTIKEEIVFSPAELRYRVYIIDEVHMISASAFNALLKTLEEPPPHVVFILATTELHKLPATIVSRCQRFDFRRLESPVIAARLLHVAKAEGIDLAETGARLIARIAQGGMRDALSLLELCAGLQKKIDDKLVIDTLGAGDREQVFSLIRALLNTDYEALFATVSELVLAGRDLSVFVRELLDCYRDLMVTKTVEKPAELLDLTDRELAVLRELVARFTTERLICHSRLLEEALARMQRGVADKRSTVEVALCRLCDGRLSADPESLLARIAALEQRVALVGSGVTLPAPVPPAASAPEQDREATPSAPQKAAPEKAQPSSAEDAYRSLACWHDIVDAMCAARPSNAGVFFGSKAYQNGQGKILVRLKNAVFVSMLKLPSSMAELQGAISAQLERPVSANDIVVEQDSGGAAAADGTRLIDEVLAVYGEEN